MLRRPRRLVLGLLPVVLSLSLVACGDESGSGSGSDEATGLKAVTISGDIGTAPEVDWKSRMSAGKVEATTIDEGDGAEVADGQQVLTQVWIGNGYTKEQAYSTYDEKTPELITLDDTLSPVFAEAIEGHTIGSRVAVTASASEAFGEAGNPSLGIGNEDSVLVIVDLVSGVATEPTGAATPAPAWMPALVPATGNPTGFDFAGIPQPTGAFRKATLITGDGAAVKKGQTIVVNYLGQVYGGAAPFDESYSKGAPTSFGIGVGTVIPGWDKALVGVTVGSRVVLQIPPKLGYDTAGNPDAGIKGTDTLFFVIDILAAG